MLGGDQDQFPERAAEDQQDVGRESLAGHRRVRGSGWRHGQAAGFGCLVPEQAGLRQAGQAEGEASWVGGSAAAVIPGGRISRTTLMPGSLSGTATGPGTLRTSTGSGKPALSSPVS